MTQLPLHLYPALPNRDHARIRFPQDMPLTTSILSWFVTVALLLLVGAHASSAAPAGSSLEYAEFDDSLFDEEFELDADNDADVDPFERTNRLLFGFNQGVDTFFWRPLTSVYRTAVPRPVRRGLFRALENLRAPVVLVNQLLQGRTRDAGETLGSFVLNSTAGIGGLFDAAEEVGWDPGDEDFGQTLARAGVKPGPYIVVPLFGPNTVRDGVGSLIDIAFDPATYLLGPIQGLFISAPKGFAKKDHTADSLDELERSSVDFYAVLRSAYLQNRAAQVNDDTP
ncbi:VacJ family lipoprotein [Myxococcota bacterium]|nr:VacJ family lipoprotein [Myxococcota bacterium]